jgi:hypothetical protein
MVIHQFQNSQSFDLHLPLPSLGGSRGPETLPTGELKKAVCPPAKKCLEEGQYLAILLQSSNKALKRTIQSTQNKKVNFSEFNCILIDYIQ